MAPPPDAEVRALLAEAAETLGGLALASPDARLSDEVRADCGDLAGRLDEAVAA